MTESLIGSVAVGADADAGDEAAVVLVLGDLEDDPLPLAEGAEDAPLQRAGTEVDLGAVAVETTMPAPVLGS